MQFRYERDMTPVVLAWLRENGYLCATEMAVYGWVDIVAGRYGKRPTPRRKPPLIELVIVELKLHDVAGVLRQCRVNIEYCDYAYAAMPMERCAKMRRKTLDKFRNAGIGLLAVDGSVGALVPAELTAGPDPGLTARHWRNVRGEYQDPKELRG